MPRAEWRVSGERLVLERYRLDERLASGATAEVWRARDLQLERDVAVKLLHPHLLPDAVSRARLAAEARAAAALSHPAIVAVYEVDADGPAPALVMEYVAGGSLAARLASGGPLPPEEVARIGAEIAEALYLAHRQGIVHRDVKPGNILIGHDGRPRLVDFGIAHSLEHGAERLTTTGTVIGTLRAMAPEQLRGEAITPRTDLYGLGTVLYEALTGLPPFVETTPLALAQAQAAGPPPLDDEPPALAVIVRACLEPDPADRPLHAGALSAALRAWLAGDERPAFGIAPRPTAFDTAAQTQVQAAVPPAAAAAPAIGQPPWRRRASWLGLGGVVLAALVLAAILASGQLGPGGGPTETARPTPSAAPTAAASATAAPTPTATPDFNIDALPPPVADEVRRWWEACGTEGQPPPVDVSGMNKRDAEEALKPYREACEEEG
jgi:serine/threonine-protein kinase